jgi:hypothetical protein
MFTMMERLSRSTPRPDDAWYVTNGHQVVGPVGTDLLLRGVLARRVTDDCMVKQPAWTSWRGLRQIREIARLERPAEWDREAAAVPRAARELLRSPADLGEGLLVALEVAASATGAEVGLAHRRRALWFVTSVARGSAVLGELGQVVRSCDPALEAARAGYVVGGAPGGGAAERAIACRLGVESGGGVLMAPFLQGGRLLAVIELGRCDHAFRREDSEKLEDLLALLAS